MQYMMLQQDIYIVCLHCGPPSTGCPPAVQGQREERSLHCSVNLAQCTDGRGFSRCWPRAPSPACRCLPLKASHASAGVWEEQTAESLTEITKGVAAFCHFPRVRKPEFPQTSRRRSVKLQAGFEPLAKLAGAGCCM